VRIEISQKGDQILKQINKVIKRVGIHSRVSRDREDYYKLFIYSKINFKRLLKRGNIKVLRKKSKLEFTVNNGNKGFIRRMRS
jgi:intein/homing endonuclease